MNIFGCKFCKYIEDKHSNRLEFECSRKNFDSLLWATLTVFQVIKKVKHSYMRAHLDISLIKISSMSLLTLSLYVVLHVHIQISKSRHPLFTRIAPLVRIHEYAIAFDVLVCFDFHCTESYYFVCCVFCFFSIIDK